MLGATFRTYSGDSPVFYEIIINVMGKQFTVTLSLNSLNKHFLPYTLSETCNIYSKHPNKISILKQYFSLFDVYWGFRGLMMATILDAETAGSS